MVDRIRELCRKKGINISNLENILGFANGSIAKSRPDAIKADRVLTIAEYFDVTMEYILTGKNSIISNFKESDFDRNLIQAFWNASDDIQNMICTGLHIDYDLVKQEKKERFPA